MSKGVKHFSIPQFVDFFHALTGPNRTRNQALAMMNATTGFRISELLILRVKDVWEKGELKPRITVPKRHMKKKIQTRSVVMSKACRQYLVPWLNQIKRDGFLKPETPLFYWTKSDPMHWADKTTYRDHPTAISRFTAYKIYNKAAQIAGITGRVGTHSLRKLFGNEGYKETGRDIHQTANLLGQKSPESTRHYLPTEQDYLDLVVENVGAKLLDALDF